MSSTASSPAPSSSSSSCSTFKFSEYPTKDIACAAGSTAGIPSNYPSIFSSCCKTAPVETWGSDCGKWCLAVEQTVADLTKCLMDGGVQANQIFCSGNNTASATGKPSSTRSAGTSTGTSTGPSGTAAGGQTSSTSSPGVGVPVVPPQVMSKAGVGMLAVVLMSAVAGAML